MEKEIGKQNQEYRKVLRMLTCTVYIFKINVKHKWQKSKGLLHNLLFQTSFLSVNNKNNN